MGKTDTSTPTTTLAGRLWKFMMGLLLVVVGWVFVQYLWGSYQRARVTDSWQEVSCEIVSAERSDLGSNQKGLPKFGFEVRYEYEIGGEKYVGDRYRRLPTEASDPRKIEKLLKQYPEGSGATCFVDPEDPKMAVLKKESKAGLYSIWFPCLFVVGGAGMIISALFRRA